MPRLILPNGHKPPDDDKPHRRHQIFKPAVQHFKSLMGNRLIVDETITDAIGAVAAQCFNLGATLTGNTIALFGNIIADLRELSSSGASIEDVKELLDGVKVYLESDRRQITVAMNKHFERVRLAVEKAQKSDQEGQVGPSESKG